MSVPAALLRLQDLAEESFEARAKGCVERVSTIILSVGTGSGGRYTLLHRGQKETSEPVELAFATLKYVAHAPLGLFGAYFPGSLADQEPDSETLTKLLSDFESTNKAVESLPVDEASKSSCSVILEKSIQFVKSHPSVDQRTFTEYARDIGAAVQQTMRRSAEIQLSGIARQLSLWKERVGPNDWAELYAAIGSGWARVNNSPRQQAVVIAMGEEAARQRLFTVQGAKTEEALLQRLSRILNQHDLAELFFEDRERMDEDLMGRPAKNVLEGCC